MCRLCLFERLPLTNGAPLQIFLVLSFVESQGFVKTAVCLREEASASVFVPPEVRRAAHETLLTRHNTFVATAPSHGKSGGCCLWILGS